MATRLRALTVMARVVVLGGGVGGTAVANRLARRRPELEIIVVDSHGDHLYQPGFVRVPFEGETLPLAREEGRLLRPGVRLLIERVAGIHADTRRVRFETGETLSYDGLVLATGSRLDHWGIPGLREASHNFHCRRAAHRLRQALSQFRGDRVVVGAVSLPYKCTPSPVEFALLLDEWLRVRGLRSGTRLTYVYPLPDVLPQESLARTMRSILEGRDVELRTSFPVAWVDPSRRTVGANGRWTPFDLLVLVPPHTAQPFLRSSGFTNEGGWVRTDPLTLRVAERIYALGDTTNLPLPKTGSGARLQARTVVENVLAEIEGRGPVARYDGRALCLVETGDRRASSVKFAYGCAPTTGSPSRWAYWLKRLFGRFYFELARRS